MGSSQDNLMMSGFLSLFQKPSGIFLHGHDMVLDTVFSILLVRVQTAVYI